jgi:hypothetical protein
MNQGGPMKKKAPHNQRIPTSELLRRLSPEGFQKLNHQLDVRVRLGVIG